MPQQRHACCARTPCFCFCWTSPCSFSCWGNGGYGHVTTREDNRLETCRNSRVAKYPSGISTSSLLTIYCVARAGSARSRFYRVWAWQIEMLLERADGLRHHQNPRQRGVDSSTPGLRATAEPPASVELLVAGKQGVPTGIREDVQSLRKRVSRMTTSCSYNTSHLACCLMLSCVSRGVERRSALVLFPRAFPRGSRNIKTAENGIRFSFVVRFAQMRCAAKIAQKVNNSHQNPSDLSFRHLFQVLRTHVHLLLRLLFVCRTRCARACRRRCCCCCCRRLETASITWAGTTPRGRRTPWSNEPRKKSWCVRVYCRSFLNAV